MTRAGLLPCNLEPEGAVGLTVPRLFSWFGLNAVQLPALGESGSRDHAGHSSLVRVPGTGACGGGPALHVGVRVPHGSAELGQMSLLLPITTASLSYKGLVGVCTWKVPEKERKSGLSEFRCTPVFKALLP